tara:strand:+ start:487 stop:771 length:285 start_codon:yes stop_codon:yes gene_type:complete
VSKYDPEYYLKNKEVMSAANKAWYLKNKAKILDSAKEKRKARTEDDVVSDKQKRKEYYEANKDKFLENSRKSYRDMREKLARLNELESKEADNE